MVKLRFRLGLVTAKPLALQGALEYGSDLHVNKRHKIRHCVLSSDIFIVTFALGLLKIKNKSKKEWQMAIFLLRAART